MGPSIFYSWQTDSPADANKALIRAALEDACKQIAAAELCDAPRVDTGMEGVCGTPEVASVMFEKIDRAAVFVGDLTLTGTCTRADGDTRKVANPNVMMETGYAAARLGWARIICVMNEVFGGPKEQAFDVRNRRFPITFSAEPGANNDRPRKELARTLRGAILSVLSAELRTAQDSLELLDADCMMTLLKYRTHDTWHTMELPADSKDLVGTAEKYAITRLLELRLLALRRVSSPPGLVSWHYEWTYLGRRVIGLLAGTGA